MSEKSAPQEIKLSEYRAPDYLIEKVFLTIEIDDYKTVIKSKMGVVKNHTGESRPLVLDGEGLTLESVAIDEVMIGDHEYKLGDESLTLYPTAHNFVVEIENTINPSANTALEGIYKSGPIICSQCEPHGFRWITYFIDRPDNMSLFITEVIANKKDYPILLSNGNLVEKGDMDDGRHYAVWSDPFKKPSYLFALVAADLYCKQDSYTTGSDREIDLRIYVEKGNEDKCDHAMESLKKSMKWDEDVYGLEYDLNIYMIVAVSAFNMGAMENKGLNIFNTSCVLANPKTASDRDYYHIEGVIGHEYFHNWTGNRVTCRDWFQLTLKEGLTVFRDQEFTADMHSRPVKRISDVTRLKEIQFPEDAGPNSHPIRPESYIEINNFYTPTVYEKGAEVIRMIHTLLGPEKYRAGMDLYFKRFDGMAVTCDDFVSCMESASGRDLSQFMNWYKLAGTPNVRVEKTHDSEKETLSIKIHQDLSHTTGHATGHLHFPFRLAVFNGPGESVVDEIVEITKEHTTIEYKGVKDQHYLSLNRGFDTPVNIDYSYDRDELAFLMAHDTDFYNRWDSGQVYAKLVLNDLVASLQKGESPSIDENFLSAYKHLLEDQKIDPGLKSRALCLPTENALIRDADCPDFESIKKAHDYLRLELGTQFTSQFIQIYDDLQKIERGGLTSDDVYRRGLKNVCLNFLNNIPTESYREMAFRQFETAATMTDCESALSALCKHPGELRDQALAIFETDWANDPLVMNKWFAIQSLSGASDTMDRVKMLSEHPRFNIKIPNDVYSLLRTFSYNSYFFNMKGGEGYKFIVDHVRELDRINPQVASGILQGFAIFKKLDGDRSKIMKGLLTELVGVNGLSKNVFERVSNIIR
ncbi:MAG: aminopeptidase N [Bacteriovoracaceae bacterium]|nr:aminopeptidase N [Bacteriovoracaceae bacterium]